MFKRKHHLHIATILQALDADFLAQQECLFGGGTAIVLSHGEYRESLDIDFLISNRAGYQALRHLLTGSEGIDAIVRQGMKLISSQKIRADQYGIRTMLRVAEVEIKFEIVLEGRIQLERHDGNRRICGIAALTELDMAASKLLANSDRWHDDSVFSRDLIDLAMLDLTKASLIKALEKAKGAYGESVTRDLNKAVESLMKRKGRLEECMSALKMDHTPKALLWERLRNLKKFADTK